jgi:hypothetical protein
MPVWLRIFTFNKIKDHYDKIKEEQEKQNSMLTNKKSKELAKPNVPTKPDYVSKAPKK